MLLFGMLAVCVLLACVTGCGDIIEVDIFGDLMKPPVEYPCGAKVLIFHAEWCHWCPTTDQINALQNQFPNCEVVAVNIDKYPEMKAKYHVTTIPRYFVCDETGCRTTTSLDELKSWLGEL